ncbi:MAG: metal-dependent hydrolase [Maribacter sp.]
MDSLTQIVLGAAVGEAVLGKKVGNKAMLYGAIAGTIPDLDVIARYLVDTVTATEWHRGFSHSIVFSVLFAPLFGWLVWKINAKSDASWKDWSWLMFWGLFTHPLLDAFTTWGTQLFWPLETRLAFQSIFVIDPLYTLPFLGCLILVFFQKRATKKRKRYLHLGFILSTSYLLITLILKGIAFQRFENALQREGIAYTQLNTRPAPFKRFCGLPISIPKMPISLVNIRFLILNLYVLPLIPKIMIYWALWREPKRSSGLSRLQKVGIRLPKRREPFISMIYVLG